jgi:hypothetical protein
MYYNVASEKYNYLVPAHHKDIVVLW